MKVEAVLSITTIILTVVVAAPTSTLAQAELSRGKEIIGPSFHLDVSNLASPRDSTLSRLNFYLKITNDELQFVKTDTGFHASYEVTVVIFDEDGEQADGKIWQDQVNVSGYEQTNSRRDFSIGHAAFDLAPGDYNLSIGVMDLDTRKTNQQETSVQLRDFSTPPLSVSDITYVGDLEIDSLGISSIRPEVSDNTVGVGRRLFAYFEIYSNLPGDSVRVSYRILNSKNKEALSGSYLRKIVGFRTLDYFPIAPDSLFFGKYTTHLKIEAADHRDETEKMFNVRWIGLPATAADLELAVEQVKYIASKEEYEKLKRGTQEDKLREFQSFWKRRDPTPGTEVNEAMDEHYSRVQYANETFTVFRDGWKTDMGMVYIILGSPDDIARNPYPADDKPYEIWYYYTINRQFLFYDYTGFGDYRLANPYSFYELNRLRY